MEKSFAEHQKTAKLFCLETFMVYGNASDSSPYLKTRVEAVDLTCDFRFNISIDFNGFQNFEILRFQEKLCAGIDTILTGIGNYDVTPLVVYRQSA